MPKGHFPDLQHMMCYRRVHSNTLNMPTFQDLPVEIKEMIVKYTMPPKENNHVNYKNDWGIKLPQYSHLYLAIERLDPEAVKLCIDRPPSWALEEFHNYQNSGAESMSDDTSEIMYDVTLQHNLYINH